MESTNMKSTDTHTRVEVLETRMLGFEKTLGVVVEKIDGIARAFAAQPHHVPFVDQLRAIGATVAVMSALFGGMNWWLNTNLEKDRAQLQFVTQQTTDLPVIRYRVEQMEKEKSDQRIATKNP
jgi:hypothetical protein